jgi:Ca-activated chloride channel family protein
MNNKDVAPTRMEAAKRAGRQLAAKLPQDFKLGLVVFGTRADQLVEPTTDKARVITALNGVKVRGYTAMGDALGLAIDAARVPTSGGTRPPARIVLLSDGASTRAADPITVAQRAKRYRIPVTTVALGNPPSDATTLQEIARTTGGRYYTVRDAQKLSQVYSGLGNRFSKLQAKQQVTAAFAGGALVFLLAGAGVGLVRGGRLP